MVESTEPWCTEKQNNYNRLNYDKTAIVMMMTMQMTMTFDDDDDDDDNNNLLVCNIASVDHANNNSII